MSGIEVGINQETVTPCMSIDLDFKVISHPSSLFVFFMTTWDVNRDGFIFTILQLRELRPREVMMVNLTTRPR